MKSKIVDVERLEEICKEIHSQGKRIVVTSGCFDIVHAGHVMYLEEAKGKGDCLIVLLNSDRSVRKLKGDQRPIIPEKERSIVVAAFEKVDYVCVFDDETPCSMLKRLQPDYFVKGGDYKGKRIPEMDVLNSYGGEVVYVTLVDGCSTTNVVEKIKQLFICR